MVRFAAIAARAEAGTLRPPRPHTTPPGTPKPDDRPKRLPPPRNPLPQGFAWLVRMIQVTAQSGGHLQYFLSQPEVIAFLEAAPQAARLLRPLCRALAFHPDPALMPPPNRPARPRPPKPPKPPRPPRENPDPRILRRKPPPDEPGITWVRRFGMWLPEPIRPKPA
jgi:hypothetical protein